MKLESPFGKKKKKNNTPTTSVQHGKVTPLKDLADIAIFKNSKTLYMGNKNN